MKSASSSLGFATTPSMVILLRLLDPSHSRFEDIPKHKPVYVLVVAKINLNVPHLAIHASGDPRFWSPTRPAHQPTICYSLLL